MNTKTVSVLALIASMGLALPALAQTDQQKPAAGEQTQPSAPAQPDTAAQPPAGGTSTEQGAAPESGAAPDSAAAPSATDDKAPDTAAAPSATDDKSATASTATGQIVMQDNDTFLASDFVGTTVYSPEEESLGDVTDLIFAKDGTLQGVVIGVGGFLGIGQKDVAFAMDRIEMNETEDGIRLSLAATSEEMADAEAFKSKKTQKVEADAERARQEQERAATGTGGTTPNPAAPPSQ